MNDDRESLARAASDLPDEEDSELVRRLKALQWPAVPADVKERCLREIIERMGPCEPPPDG